MPFTLSHAVLAPPLSKLSGNRLPIAALAIGTMTPDLYRILVQNEIHLNHQFKGIIYPDLCVGLLFCLLWYALYRPLLFKFLGIYKPLNIQSTSIFFNFLFWIILAVLLGTATHIIWDGLTHLDFRTFAFNDFLAQSVTILDHIYPMHKVLQIGCSIVALPFLFWMGLHYFFKYRSTEPLNRKVSVFCLSLFAISFFSGCLYYIHAANESGLIPQQTDLYILIGFFMKVFTQASMICFSFGCCLFLYLNHKKYFAIV